MRFGIGLRQQLRRSRGGREGFFFVSSAFCNHVESQLCSGLQIAGSCDLAVICLFPVYALLSMLSRFHEHVLNRPVLGYSIPSYIGLTSS